MSLLQADGNYVSMRSMVDVLLELGGDLSKVNIVGNDFVAVAGRKPASLPGCSAVCLRTQNVPSCAKSATFNT